jgi:hypothetical protein
MTNSTQPDALEKLRATSRGLVAFAFLGVATALASLVVFTSDSEELSPRHPGDTGWVTAISLGFGALSFAMMFWPKPRTVRSAFSALLWSLFVAFMWFPVSGITLQRIHEIADFSNVPIAVSERDLPVETAFVSHGRRISYEVWLACYSALLRIDERDYRAAFGTVERVRPDGFCIHATVQTTAHASRIMTGSGRSLPAGSLVRCPPRA